MHLPKYKLHEMLDVVTWICYDTTIYTNYVPIDI